MPVSVSASDTAECQSTKANLVSTILQSRKQKIKKSHTCEEGGAHLRISFWHVEVGQ